MLKGVTPEACLSAFAPQHDEDYLEGDALPSARTEVGSRPKSRAASLAGELQVSWVAPLTFDLDDIARQ